MSDGSTSFAVFVYENLALIDEIQSYQVGFNLGDGGFLNIIGTGSALYTEELYVINAFRIDGNVDTILFMKLKSLYLLHM